MKNLKYVYAGIFLGLGLLYLKYLPSTGKAAGFFNHVQYNTAWLAGLVFIIGLLIMAIYYKD